MATSWVEHPEGDDATEAYLPHSAPLLLAGVHNKVAGVRRYQMVTQDPPPDLDEFAIA